MVQVRHISFKDWKPIGKPRKNPKEKSVDLTSDVKNESMNNADLKTKITSTKEPYGVAATLELSQSYVKEQNFIYSVDKQSNILKKVNGK